MLEVLSQLTLGAPESVIRLVREGAAIAPERAWEVLNGEHSAGQRWLLVFDNADNPAVLAATGGTSPADGTGWLRPGTTGMVLVTIRNMDSRAWGRVAQIRELGPLDDAAAAQLLKDLAPGIHDPGGQHARELGHRLGGLPLALHLAGTYLASPFARWHSFANYLEALDSEALPAALAELDDPRAQARVTVARTWELSLEAIATDGCPQARSLLFLLSCYAANAVIPIGLPLFGSRATLSPVAFRSAEAPREGPFGMYRDSSWNCACSRGYGPPRGGRTTLQSASRRRPADPRRRAPAYPVLQSGFVM
jgi:hypothetical protein